MGAVYHSEEMGAMICNALEQVELLNFYVDATIRSF